MSDSQTLVAVWLALCFGPPLVWMAAIELVRWRNRRNVVDLSEWRYRRELDGAIQRHPAAQSKNVRRVGGRVTIR